MAIGGVKVYSTKMVADPLRCSKCQSLGHRADKCSKDYACGTCGEKHNTKECQNRQKPYCVTCQSAGHPAWSKGCPNFLTGTKRGEDHLEDRFYTYYITNNEWTWEPLGESTKQRRRPRPARPTMGSVLPQNDATAAMPSDVPTTPKQPTETATAGDYQPIPPPPWSPTAPFVHPRPENIAQPSQMSSVGLGLTQSTLSWPRPCARI